MRLFFSLLLLWITSSTYGQENRILKTHTLEAIQSDYDLMIRSLREAHPGLYWYTSISSFDSLARTERNKLYEGMDSYVFFRIASKIVAATKEGHCRIGSSRDVGQYFNQKAILPPVVVKVLNDKVYLLNDIDGQSTKGKILTKINDEPVDEIITELFKYTSKYADGHITTGKIRYSIDYTSLAYYYADYFENTPIYALELKDEKSGNSSVVKVKGLSASDFGTIDKGVSRFKLKEPIELRINDDKTAYLAIHSFRHTYYDHDGNETVAFEVFSSKIDSVFRQILHSNVKKLIIDIRHNGGGTEGYEDYVLSYLTDQVYNKYKYVETNALGYSFLEHTQYNTAEEVASLERDLKKEFEQSQDGRYLRRKGFMKVEPPKEITYKGELFVLISGKTYSGGSEFAGLLRDKTKALFIGEETGGGYYGQSSGYGLTLTLPNTQIRIRIPLFKFVTDFNAYDIPIGRGVIPDYKIQPTIEEYLSGTDAVKRFAMKLDVAK